MPDDKTDVRLEDITTQFQIPRVHYDSRMRRPSGGWVANRDFVMRVVVWMVPLVFGAGALYFSIQNMGARVGDLEEKIGSQDMALQELKMSRQRIESKIELLDMRTEKADMKLESLEDENDRIAQEVLLLQSGTTVRGGRRGR